MSDMSEQSQVTFGEANGPPFSGVRTWSSWQDVMLCCVLRSVVRIITQHHDFRQKMAILESVTTRAFVVPLVA